MKVNDLRNWGQEMSTRLEAFERGEKNEAPEEGESIDK